MGEKGETQLITSDHLQLKDPTGFEKAVQMTREEMEQHIRLMAALKMFELGKVSSGKAAELAGLSKLDFFEACGRYRVSFFNYPDESIVEELEQDLNALKFDEFK